MLFIHFYSILWLYCYYYYYLGYTRSMGRDHFITILVDCCSGLWTEISLFDIIVIIVFLICRLVR